MVLGSFHKMSKEISSGEFVYGQFLIKHQNELLHNIDESIRSIDEKIKQEEEDALADYDEINKEYPSDDERDEIRAYRQTEITNIADYLNRVVTKLTTKKQELLATKKRFNIRMRILYQDVANQQNNT